MGISLHGDVFVERSKFADALLQVSADVFVGDLIETEANSGLTMHLGKATVVKLGALAKFRIDKYVVDAGGLLDLDQGPLVIDHDDSAKSERLRVRSPFCLIAVRGTMFFAGPSKGVLGVFVGRGVVTVPAAGGPSRFDAARVLTLSRPGAAPSRAEGVGAGARRGRTRVGGVIVSVVTVTGVSK